jgi:hypothetical protein
MANKIILKKTSTASKVPLSTDLEVGEIAVNLADQKLYSKDASGTVILVGQGVAGSGDVVGGSSSTDNALARYDGTTGKLIQNSVVIVGDTGSITGVNALTAESLTVNNDSTLGFSNTDTLDVRARIISDLEPNANNAKDIGTNGRNWRDAFFGRTLSTVNIEVTGTTSFDGSQGTSGQVLTSAGTGNTPTWTTPTTGTVTSVSATAGTGISVSGSPITTSGTLTITNTAPDQTVSLTGSGATSISGTYPNFTISSTNTTYSQATSTTLGLIELGSDTVQTVAPNAVTATASRSYALQLNSAGQAMVNVPWTDTNSGGTVTSVSALTLGTTGTDLSSTVANGTTTPVITLNVPTASASNRGALSSADWSTFNGKINLSSAITGYTVGTNTALVATDTLLASLGKIQGQINARSGTVTSVGGTGTVSGLTLSGTVTTSGNLTLGGNLSITADMIYQSFTATASQTTFTPTTAYTASKISVYANGVKMVNGADVTVTSGTSVVFATGVASGTRVDLVYPI